jgi:hypothetical protein
MKKNAWIPLLVVAATLSSFESSYATLLFSQDFSSAPNGPVSTYVNSTAPNSGQWNAIQVTTANMNTTVAINNGALSYTRSSASGVGGSFTRSTDFSPVPEAFIYNFTLTVSGNSAVQTTAATWQVGDGFNPGSNAAESGYYSRFGINFTSTPGTFQFRDISGSANSGNFSGSQSVMWVLNNSGSTLSYLAPDNSTRTVANDRWDLWAGTTLVFDEKAALLTGSALANIKFAFEAGVGSIAMDDFSITTVPEPTNAALGIFALGLFAFGGFNTWRNSRRTHRPSTH